MSLWDKAGEHSLTHDPAAGLAYGMSRTFSHFVAGMMKLSRELAIFIAPNINSYKRYASLSWAPVNVVWGRDNRTTGFRVVGHGTNLHVEDRFPGGDMNAYLTYAAAIGAGLYGIEHELKLEPEFKGNGYIATGCQRMPRALYEAIWELEKSEAGSRDLRPGRHRPLPQCRPLRAAGLRLGRPQLGPRALPRAQLDPAAGITRPIDADPGSWRIRFVRLTDKVAIITGGGGGMGRVAAQLFAAEGAKVVVAEFSDAAGSETVDLVRKAGGEATFVKVDVSREADAKAMVDHAVATYGRLDVLYNNAGIMPEADHSVIDTDVETWDKVMAVNVRGVFLGCKYAIPAMVDGRLGLDHQHRQLRRPARLLGSPGRLHGLEGRAPRPDPQPGRPVRPEGDPDERDLPGPGRDAAADGLAGQGRGGQAAPPGPQPDRPVRQARGDRVHGDVPRLRRIALDERRPARRRRRDQRELLLMARWWLMPGAAAIGVDVGGTGIKAALVDVRTGELAGERIRVLTPLPSKPGPVVASAGRVVGRLIRAANAAATAAGQPAPVIQAIGVGFPSPVINGVTKTAANVDPEWVGFDAQAAFTKAFKRRAWLVNDADAAGVAEMRFGAGHGKRGVVIVLTLGTGVGSAIFVDGRLVPNTELGHMEVSGRDAERRSSANARVRRGPELEGLGRGPRRAPPGDRRPVQPEPDHPGRRDQQEGRPVPAVSQDARSRSWPPSSATRRASSARRWSAWSARPRWSAKRRTWPSDGRGSRSSRQPAPRSTGVHAGTDRGGRLTDEFSGTRRAHDVARARPGR